VTCDARGAQLVSSPSVGYETVEGEPVYATGKNATVSLTIPARASLTGQEIGRRAVVPGQASSGPISVGIRW